MGLWKGETRPSTRACVCDPKTPVFTGEEKAMAMSCARCGVSFTLRSRREHDRHECDRLLRIAQANAETERQVLARRAASAPSLRLVPEPALITPPVNEPVNTLVNASASVNTPPVNGEPAPAVESSLTEPPATSVDRRAYMRDYMRRRRAAARAT
jgi:hypothetical protein